MFGKLYVCATPIGNLGDITLRALETLKEVDYIAAEDTRHTKKLLNHYDIHTPLISYHEHNKQERGLQLIKMLKEGKKIALVSDAGTPGISDPGEELVRQCSVQNIEITALPGAAACITGLILSGLSTRRFVFEGFLPNDKKIKQGILQEIVKETRTIILYESPHHIRNTLMDLSNVLGNRKIVLARELTKRFEEIKRTTLDEVIRCFQEENPRGEYVIIIEGKSFEEVKKEEIKQWEQFTIEEHMKHYQEQGIHQKEAMKKVAKDRGISKREVYAQVHRL